MTHEDWMTSDDARWMLQTLHAAQPDFLITQVASLHRYFIACCWKNQHLIPQEELREGLRGAEKWLDGELSDEELNRLDWYAEAEAFRVDYAKTPEELEWLKSLIHGIPELDGMPFNAARALIVHAAYFTDSTIVYSTFESLPWVKTLMESELLCSELLREYIEPLFENPV